MSTSTTTTDLATLAKSIAEQGEHVRTLKAAGASTPTKELEEAIAKLTALKNEMAALQADSIREKERQREWRAGLEDLLTRRFFYLPSFEIYGGVGGLYDFGPTGCAVKQNLLAFWRSHFIMQESMLEVDCVSMTPYQVLKTSGHVDKFTDFMVKDEKTGDCYRADKILEDGMDKLIDDVKKPPTAAQKDEYLAVKTKAGAMNKDELHEALTRYNITAPDTGNPISAPFPFNLMFETQIGPTGKLTGYLRPETAQGIFVNFRRLLEQNAGRMPFACAQIGSAFRNEIAPRAGLLRVREFTLAEIEHFVNPENKMHPRFSEVSHVKLALLPRSAQTGEDKSVLMTVGEAVSTGVINNETLGYYMARTHLFLVSVGVRVEKLRFRQHKATEMAHYAADCWDAEIFGSYGWIECVGHADRSAYDLRVHSEASKVELMAQEVYDQPRMVDAVMVRPNQAVLGKKYGKQHKALVEHLRALSVEEARALSTALSSGAPHTVTLCDGSSFEVDASTVDIKFEQKKISSAKYIPSVIEPSFGIGRILYHVLEHAYSVRDDGKEKEKEKSKTAVVQRSVLSLPAFMAPVKVALLPISANDVFTSFLEEMNRTFLQAGVVSRVDQSSVSIGKRYARADEIGTPFDVTVDFQTVQDRTVTLRERDSTQQIRLPIASVLAVVTRLIAGQQQVAIGQPGYTWANAYAEHEQVIRSDADDE